MDSAILFTSALVVVASATLFTSSLEMILVEVLAGVVEAVSTSSVAVVVTEADDVGLGQLLPYQLFLSLLLLRFRSPPSSTLNRLTDHKDKNC